MFTTCPKCSLKLVVTAADLRVAQGHVRCGRCSNVFNALAGLSDEQQAVLAREPDAAPRETSPSAEANARGPMAPPSPAPAPPSGAAPAPPQAEEPISDEALEFDPSSTDVSEVFVDPPDEDPTGTFESIVLGTDEVEHTSETDDQTQLPADDLELPSDAEPRGGSESGETHELEIDLEALVAVTIPLPRAEAKQQAPAPSEPASHDRTSSSTAARESESEAPAPRRAATREPARQADVAPKAPGAPNAPNAPIAPLGPPERTPETPPFPVHSSRDPAIEALAAELDPLERTADVETESDYGARFNIDRGLRIGSVALAVLLVLQIVNHERVALAGIPWLRAPLTAVYSGLGMPLAPRWNVHAYEVRQLGADARNPGALTVRASVTNTASRDQPLPLLRVTMQDRFGNRIAARDVPPSAYLPAGSASGASLPAGQRVDAEIAFADPGPNAVGFEIDACLKLASGRVACANDAGPER